MRSTVTLLLLIPVSAFGCDGCRPAVLHIGLSAAYLADVASMFVSLAAAIACAFFTPWEKLPWMTRAGR